MCAPVERPELEDAFIREAPQLLAKPLHPGIVVEPTPGSLLAHSPLNKSKAAAFLHATALARARISSGDCFCIRERPLSRNGMVAVAAAGLLIALLTYLTAAPVGAETGIPLQGRYFIELLPTLVALTLAPLLIEKAQVATPAWLTLGRILERSVLVFLLALLPLCFAVIEAVLLDRYYVR